MKFLFILGTYLPKASANGICVINVINEIKNQGHSVHCLCWDNVGKKHDIVDGVEITRVFVSSKYSADNIMPKSRVSYKFISLIDKTLSYILFPFYPNHRIGISKRMERHALDLMRKNEYDCIISVFQPFDALFAGYSIAKKYPSTKWVLYYLDIFSGGIKPTLLSQKRFFKKTYKWECKFFERCDLALIMESYGFHYKTKMFEKYKDRIKYADFPLIDSLRPPCEIVQTKHDDLRFLLSGKIDFAMRNPTYVLSLMEKILKSVPSHFDFCGTQDWQPLLDSFQASVGNSFTYHGRVDYQTAKKMEDEADVLISIGNSFSGAVPSKIFSYMSRGKIILHTYSDPNDPALAYLRLYPKAILLNEKDSSECLDVFKIVETIEKNYDRIIDPHTLNALFPKNTVRYTSDLILSCVE